MNRNKLIIFLIIAPLFAIMLAAAQVYYYFAIWEYSGPETTFVIKPGESFSSINYRLKKQGLISNAKIFYRYASLQKIVNKFRAGEYVIPSHITMPEIIDTLLSGRSKTVPITIAEGKNLYEIGKLLARKKITSYQDFVQTATDRNFVGQLGIPADSAEGYLFPETYRFTRNSSAKYIIKTMVKEFNRKIKNLDFTVSHLTKHQVIILASIVEKETGAAWERPKIAGIFLNRLKKHMRLQSDPTTIYGIYEHFDGNLRKKDLQQKTAYNTYRINGLPKGPICNPGLDAIKAVLHPEKHHYLYFVSMNDGTHVFSEHYRDHIKAVNKYQKSRKYRVGRSWRDLRKKQRATNK